MPIWVNALTMPFIPLENRLWVSTSSGNPFSSMEPASRSGMSGDCSTVRRGANAWLVFNRSASLPKQLPYLGTANFGTRPQSRVRR